MLNCPKLVTRKTWHYSSSVADRFYWSGASPKVCPPAVWQLLLNHYFQRPVFSLFVEILSVEAGLPLFPGDRLLVSLVRGRGAEFEMSLSLLCSVRASCLSLVNLGLGVSQDSEGGGLVAQATEVYQTEPQHSVQGPSGHCPCNSQDSTTFPLTLTPHILPLSSESAFFRWHLGDPRI